MMSTIILWLVGKGLSEKWARRAMIAVGVLVAFLGCVALKTCYERRIISNHEKVLVAKEIAEKVIADEASTVQREKDTELNGKKEDDRKIAIAKTVDSPPSASSIKLGCERLRQDGYKIDQFPECR